MLGGKPEVVPGVGGGRSRETILLRRPLAVPVGDQGQPVVAGRLMSRDAQICLIARVVAPEIRLGISKKVICLTQCWSGH